MTTRSEIIRANPIGRGLDCFRDTHDLVLTDEGNTGAHDERTISSMIAGKNATAVHLLLAVQFLDTAELLPSKRGTGTFRSELSTLRSAVVSDYYDCERIKPLLDAVLNKKPDEVIWDAVYELIPPPHALSPFTRSFANSTQHRKYIDVSNKTQSNPEGASTLRSPFSRLPPEIRCKIYRILLRSNRSVRMIPPPRDRYHVPRPNNLHPSILGTCRLIYQEAHYVLYGENYFVAHRVNENNHNAALIRRAKYYFGTPKQEDDEDDARELVDFLGSKSELRYIVLVIAADVIADPDIFDLVRQALKGHPHLINIKIEIPSGLLNLIGLEHTWRLKQIVKDQARLLEWLGES